jgi:hypothetical protein
MNLTAVEFAKLICDLRCDMRPSERRLNPRAPTRKHVEVIRVHPRPAMPASEWFRVRDISRNGLGLMSNDHAEIGSRMLVLLPKNANETFVLLCEIARVTRLGDDTYGFGLRMVRRVSEEERAAYMHGSADAVASLLAVVPAPGADASTATPVVAPATPAVAA